MNVLSGRRRLVFVLYSAFPSRTGGRETWLKNMVERLCMAYDITVIALRSSILEKERDVHTLPSEIEVVRIPSLSSFPGLRQIGKRSYGRLLNAFIFSAGAFLYLLFRPAKTNAAWIAIGSIFEALPLRWLRSIRRNAQYICSVRGRATEELAMTYPLMRRYFRRVERKNLDRARMIWTNGQDTGRVLESLGYSSSLMKNGVDVGAFSQPGKNYKRPSFMQETPKHVVMIATLRRIRGLDTAIKACAALKTGPSFRLVFVGKGNQDRWRRLAEELGVSDRVIFAGERMDIPDIVFFSDIILAFCKEAYGGGLSMSLLETMAGGKPIIAWDNSIYRQILTDGEDAVLVPEEDPQELADKIQWLLERPEICARLGDAAREAVRAFDWTKVIEEFEENLDYFISQDG